jgi:hypothetical protein
MKHFSLNQHVKFEVSMAMKICCGFLVSESVGTNMEAACFSETTVIYHFCAQDGSGMSV